MSPEPYPVNASRWSETGSSPETSDVDIVAHPEIRYEHDLIVAENLHQVAAAASQALRENIGHIRDRL